MEGGDTEQESEEGKEGKEGKWRDGIQSRSLRRGGRGSGGEGKWREGKWR